MEAQKAYLKSIGIDISEMREQEIKEANTRDKVFIAIKCRILDAIEEINLRVFIQALKKKQKKCFYLKLFKDLTSVKSFYYAEKQEVYFMLDATKVINGTYGQVFLGDDEVAEMKAFQAKLEFQKEEIKVAGQMAVDTKLMSYSGKGSLQ